MAAYLVRCRNRLYVFLLLCPICISAFLNLEELNEMKYEIRILPDPVIMGQTKTDEVMMVSSKFKQPYECRLPAQAVRFHQDSMSDSDSQGYTGPDIPDLLSPMREPPCLVLTKDWWTYEFCHGQHIRQYHLEDSEIKGDVLILGYYESEFDWSNETAKASKQHRMKRFHSQTYVNGSKCDINGNPREAEVRFVCEDGSGDYIARVDEPLSCRYVLTIHTSRTCQHPFLRPPSTAKPQGIVCQPALSQQQYMDYVKAQVSDTKKKVAQISEELRSLDEMLAGNEEAKAPVEGPAEETSPEPSDDQDQSDQKDIADMSEDAGLEDLEDSQFWEGITKPASSKSSSSHEESETVDDGLNSIIDNEVIDDANEAENFNFKIITDPSDLMKFVQHLKESNRKKAQNREKAQAEERRSLNRGTDDEEDDEDEQLLQEFKEEMADVSVPADKTDEIKETMQKEFDNIIDEAQQELDTEGLKGEFDRTQATQALETTLDKLLDHLEEKDEQDPEQQPTQAQRANDPTRGSPSLAPKQPDQDADDHVKIKITKYKTGDSSDGEFKVQELSKGDPQWQHIKDVVKEQLEKAGLKAEGKIEVKILTRKNTEEGDQWLTEEDTKSFRELLINLLTGGTEEVHKEQKRQQELENNYRFVWGEGQEESQSSSDSDDVDL
ncbi:protein OS-9 isoform X1 [Syngnathus scovelli]|uniref:protein OS-9 isoform X1 n=1 Tax=Syngnathus scovelli TaxID=161590 RepID=UPI0021107E7A|nr:protein OS-9 isoform X2 [Syngnathus scovelli]